MVLRPLTANLLGGYIAALFTLETHDTCSKQ